ncbi:primosomal protein N' [Reinekea sp.]|jgi:primosomal protein N' (replication factor Y)|uniref:primosomal protein N' n=2 Tax=Reinekea sp. TaxID=1970455 RepID=UPI00398A06E3
MKQQMQRVSIAVQGPFNGALTYLHESVLAPGIRCEVSLGPRTVIGISVNEPPDEQLDLAKLKPIKRVLDDKPILSEDILTISVWMSRYYLHEFSSPFFLALPKLLRTGKSAELKKTRWVSLTTQGQHIDTTQLARSVKQQAVMVVMQKQRKATQSHLNGLGFNTALVAALEKKQLLTTSEEVNLEPIKPTGELFEAALQLTGEQLQALEHINMDQYSPCLLEGVTGSGKTEVYLQAIEKCLKEGKRALVLVPEIGLTPQTLSRFQKRFQDDTVALHSGMTDNARHQAWVKASLGQAAIIIGTRSSILTPIPNLGLIVVDEEHDGSYKQQDTLRYHARDIALKRAHALNIPIILGSATPSLESLHNASIGRFAHLLLEQRANGSSLPPIETIDMRKQKHQAGFSERLALRVQMHLDEGNQVILFLNRRGYAPNWFCKTCGWIADCTFCDAHMTHHRAQRTNICHHCGHREAPPRQCPNCHETTLEAMGTGTERAEETIAQLFPGTPIIRFDRDIASTRIKMEQQLKLTEQDGPAIIIGTQMLAKGHHFERVTLVGIWDIDGGLFSADLRARERMGQLLTQVAGRSGRGERRGEVLVQTWYPDNPVFEPLLKHDYRSFAVSLLEDRKRSQLPPFGFLAVIRCDSAFANLAENRLQEMAHYLLDTKKVRVLGPLPALLSRRAGKHRYMLLVQCQKRSHLHEVLTPLHRHYPRDAKQVSWHIDIDPSDLA